MVRWQAGVLSMAVVLAAAAAHGQNPDAAPSPYFDCPYVNYFDRDCPQLRKLWAEQEQRRLQQEQEAARPARQPRAAAPAAPAESKNGGDPAHGPDADETYRLFPKESLAPDAPALFRRLLAEPTIENARRYVRWYARRTARLQAVQALIRLAGREFEAEMK